MLYSTDIKVPKNTPITAKQVTKLKVSDGVIHKVGIVFPSGCAGLVKIQMLDGGHQFISSTEGQYLSGDGEVVTIPDFYEIKTAPRFITIKTWNDDDTYDHTLQVRIYMLPKRFLMPAGATEGIIESMRALFLPKEVIERTLEEKV